MRSRARRTEGGHARGHSNMSHYEHTEIIKAETDRMRRRQDRVEVDEQVAGMNFECPVCEPDPCIPENHEAEVVDLYRGLRPGPF